MLLSVGGPNAHLNSNPTEDCRQENNEMNRSMGWILGGYSSPLPKRVEGLAFLIATLLFFSLALKFYTDIFGLVCLFVLSVMEVLQVRAFWCFDFSISTFSFLTGLFPFLFPGASNWLVLLWLIVNVMIDAEERGRSARKSIPSSNWVIWENLVLQGNSNLIWIFLEWFKVMYH